MFGGSFFCFIAASLRFGPCLCRCASTGRPSRSGLQGCGRSAPAGRKARWRAHRPSRRFRRGPALPRCSHSGRYPWSSRSNGIAHALILKIALIIAADDQAVSIGQLHRLNIRRVIAPRVLNTRRPRFPPGLVPMARRLPPTFSRALVKPRAARPGRPAPRRSPCRPPRHPASYPGRQSRQSAQHRPKSSFRC